MFGYGDCDVGVAGEPVDESECFGAVVLGGGGVVKMGSVATLVFEESGQILGANMCHDAYLLVQGHLRGTKISFQFVHPLR